MVGLAPKLVLLNDTDDIWLLHFPLISSRGGKHSVPSSGAYQRVKNCIFTAGSKGHCRGDLNLFKKIRQEATIIEGAEEDEGESEKTLSYTVLRKILIGNCGWRERRGG